MRRGPRGGITLPSGSTRIATSLPQRGPWRTCSANGRSGWREHRRLPLVEHLGALGRLLDGGGHLGHGRSRDGAVALVVSGGQGKELDGDHTQVVQVGQCRVQIVHRGCEQRNLRHVGQGQRLGAGKERFGQGMVAVAVQGVVQRGLVRGVGQGQVVQAGLDQVV